MRIRIFVFLFSSLPDTAKQVFFGVGAAMLFGLASGSVVFASPDVPPEKRIISKTIPRPLPDASCVRQESLDMVLDEIVSIGLKQYPHCQDYRIESRKFVTPENAAGEFEELWIAAICGKKVAFEIARKHIGYRKFSLSARVLQ